MSRFNELLNGYLHDSLSESELEEFLTLVEENKDLLDENIIREKGFETRHAGLTDPARRAKMLSHVREQARDMERKIVRLRIRQWSAAAAVLLLVLTAGGYFLTKEKGKKGPLQVQMEPFKNDVAPGSNGATLTLADGSTVVLDSTGKGNITRQGNASVVRQTSGGLAYHTTGNDQTVVYNTLSTGKGRQFQLLLPDGTRVWLNSSSSIRYPTSFGGRQRIVEMTGEAYFEVAHDASMPFVVKADKEDITVLGTHFNVNSYGDEPLLRTTLLQGAVKVGNASGNVLLTPGQQAAIYRNKEKINVATVNAEDAIAWKNGFFNFDNADLQTVMRQLARWYNVEVVYSGPVPAWGDFKGDIGRNLTLAQVLKILEQTRVHFRIEEDKRIVIFP